MSFPSISHSQPYYSSQTSLPCSPQVISPPPGFAPLPNHHFHTPLSATPYRGYFQHAPAPFTSYCPPLNYPPLFNSYAPHSQQNYSAACSPSPYHYAPSPSVTSPQHYAFNQQPMSPYGPTPQQCFSPYLPRMESLQQEPFHYTQAPNQSYSQRDSGNSSQFNASAQCNQEEYVDSQCFQTPVKTKSAYDIQVLIPSPQSPEVELEKEKELECTQQALASLSLHANPYENQLAVVILDDEESQDLDIDVQVDITSVEKTVTQTHGQWGTQLALEKFKQPLAAAKSSTPVRTVSLSSSQAIPKSMSYVSVVQFISISRDKKGGKDLIPSSQRDLTGLSINYRNGQVPLKMMAMEHTAKRIDLFLFSCKVVFFAKAALTAHNFGWSKNPPEAAFSASNYYTQRGETGQSDPRYTIYERVHIAMLNKLVVGIKRSDHSIDYFKLNTPIQYQGVDAELNQLLNTCDIAPQDLNFLDGCIEDNFRLVGVHLLEQIRSSVMAPQAAVNSMLVGMQQYLINLSAAKPVANPKNYHNVINFNKFINSSHKKDYIEGMQEAIKRYFRAEKSGDFDPLFPSLVK